MRRLNHELKEWATDLWRRHPLLALLAIALTLRLLLHFDDYFTIRDSDFFPFTLKDAMERRFRGGRYVPLLINAVWGYLSGDDPLFTKQVFGKVHLLFAIPGFLALGLRAGIGTKALGFAAVLFLGGPQLFALYDTLGPYFLLMTVGMWQVFFALGARDGRPRALLWYVLVSLIAILSHRTGLMTTALCFGVIYVGRGARSIGWRDFFVLAGAALLASWKISISMRFDAIEMAYQTQNYGTGLFEAVGWIPAPPPQPMLHGVLTLAPGWGGIHFPALPLLAVTTIVLGAAAIWGAGRVRRELRWFALGGFCLSVALAALTELMAVELFFQPNHGTYSFVWFPIFVLLLGAALERLPRRAGSVALVLLLSVNLWQGYTYRNDAFDFQHYQEVVEAEGHNPRITRRLVPSFVKNEYASRFPELVPALQQVTNIQQQNDFTTLPNQEFVIDVVTYNELGIPLYRYAGYIWHFWDWAAQRGFALKCKKHHTFVTCHATRQ